MLLPDAAATQALGARVGAQLRRGDVVCLSGALGAGKTTFARGAISAWLGGAVETPSPTYTLLQIYEGPKGELWHADLYRLRHVEEVWELGLEDAYADAACLIEWPDRIGDALPPSRLDVTLTAQGEGRRVALVGHGAWRDRVDAI
jgi:tRNA threonylcarbamoyladenosine biosynthesis protein TsaE